MLYYLEKMYFHKKHIHPLKKDILPPKKTKQLYSTQKKYIFKKKTKKYSQKVIFPQKMISRNYIPNKSLVPETKSYIPPKKIYSHQEKI